jgi:uncharacterized protein YciI
MTATSEFLYLLRPSRPDMIAAMTEQEQKIVGEHFAYLQNLLAEGQLILAGRTLEDQPFGIVVFRAESPERAEEIMKGDPAVANGVMTATLHPYSVALIQGSNT